MKAITVEPKRAASARFEDIPEPDPTQGGLLVAHEGRIDQPVAGHAEELATGLILALADWLRLGLDRPHIHLGHREAQLHGAEIDRVAGGISHGDFDHARADLSLVKPHRHLQVIDLSGLRDSDNGGRRWCAAAKQPSAERDKRDTSRAVAPLVPASDSQVLDSSALSIEEVVARILKFWAGGPHGGARFAT